MRKKSAEKVNPLHTARDTYERTKALYDACCVRFNDIRNELTTLRIQRDVAQLALKEAIKVEKEKHVTQMGSITVHDVE